MPEFHPGSVKKEEIPIKINRPQLSTVIEIKRDKILKQVRGYMSSKIINVLRDPKCKGYSDLYVR